MWIEKFIQERKRRNEDQDERRFDMLLVSVIAFSYADLLFILPRSCLIVNGQLIPAAANTVPRKRRNEDQDERRFHQGGRF